MSEKSQQLQEKTEQLLSEQKRLLSFSTSPVEDQSWTIGNNFNNVDPSFLETIPLSRADIFVPLQNSKFKIKYEQDNGKREINSVAFSPDGTKIAYTDNGRSEGQLKLWEFQKEGRTPRVTKLGDIRVNSNVAFARHTKSPSGVSEEDSILTSSDYPNDPSLSFWSTTPSKSPQTFFKHKQTLNQDDQQYSRASVKSMAYSNDGKYIVVGDSTGLLYIFHKTHQYNIYAGPIDIITSEQVSDRPIDHVTISKHQTGESVEYRIAAAVYESGADGKNDTWKIRLTKFRPQTTYSLTPNTTHYNFDFPLKPTSLAFSSDGALLAVATSSGVSNSEVSIYRIDSQKKQPLYSLQTEVQVQTVAFLSSQDQKDQKEPEALVIFSESKCQLWYYKNSQSSDPIDIINGTQTSPGSQIITAGAVSQDGKHIVIAFKLLFTQTGNSRRSQTTIQAKSLLRVYSRSQKSDI